MSASKDCYSSNSGHVEIRRETHLLVLAVAHANWLASQKDAVLPLNHVV